MNSIPFSVAMVRARKARRKRETRRLVFKAGTVPGHRDLRDIPAKGPYEPNKTYWVREAWRTEAQYNHLKPSELPANARVWFEADGPAPDGFGRYRHGRFLPQRFSRDKVTVTAVRPELVQDMDDDDAIAEGIFWSEELVGWTAEAAPDTRTLHPTSPVAAYAKLYDLINGPGAWQRNEWVWVIEFEEVQDQRRVS